MVNVHIASPDNERQQSVNRASTEHQQSINRVSTEHQQSWVLHLEWFIGCATAFTHNQHIGSLCGQIRSWHGNSPSLKMGVNRAWTILCVASCVIQGLFYGFYPSAMYWSPLLATLLMSTSLHLTMSVNRALTERQQSVNRASTERQQSWVLHLVWFKGCATSFTHNQCIGRLCVKNARRHGHSPNLKMSVTRASTSLCVASCIIQRLCYGIYP